MAPRIQPTRQEFEIKENEVVHKPTNAMWGAYTGIAKPHYFRRNMLGSVLPNGNNYREDEVTQMAHQLLAERLKK